MSEATGPTEGESAEAAGSAESEGETEQLGDLSDLADGEMRCFEDVGDYGIVVCRAKGSLYAVIDNCSHADTPLSEGRFRGHTITCPLHGAQFDVRDGTHAGPPAFEGVDVYPVAETDEGVVVTLSTSKEKADGGYGDVGARFRTR